MPMYVIVTMTEDGIAKLKSLRTDSENSKDLTKRTE